MLFSLITQRCRCTIRAVRMVHDAAASRKEPFKILFMGGDEFSAVVFEQLMAAKDVYKTVLVASYTPIHVHARSMKSKSSIPPLVTLANRYDITSLYVPKSDSNLSKRMKWLPPAPFTPKDLENNQNHLLITASFGRILPKPFLELFPPGQRLNVHPSSLPSYRGPAPLQRTIMNNERTTGVCVIETLPFKMGIDAGPIWARQDIETPPDVTFEALRDNLAKRGGHLLVSVLRDMLSGKAVVTPQDDAADAPIAPFITADDANINFHDLTAHDIVRRHRAFSHMRPLFTHVQEKTVQLLSLSVFTPPPGQEPRLPGEPCTALYDPHSRSLLVRCSEETLLSVTQMKQQDRNAIAAKEWWNGVRPEWKNASGGVGFVHRQALGQ